MYRHFITVFLLSSAQLSLAENADWNCEKNETGEWSCASESNPAQQPPPKVTESFTGEVETELLETATQIQELEKPVDLPIIYHQNPATEQTQAPDAFKINPTPPQTTQNNANLEEGWSCAPNAEKGTWDCALVGANPKGQSRLIEDDNYGWRLLDRAFNYQQEGIFNHLLGEFSQDPWEKCSNPDAETVVFRNPKKALREQSPLTIYSDYSEIYDKEVVNFVGNVEMLRADQHLVADKANFNTLSNMLDTQGNVFYSEEGLALFSQSASLRFATNNSVLRDVLFIAGDGPIRGRAKTAYWDSKELSHYKEAAYTSCRPGNQDWVIHADRLKLNKTSGLGSATGAWLEFKGIPVLYTPYINFPIDNRRTSGFLAPSWGTTDENGFDFEIPFYWNIAPNYDMTISPRYLTKRGGILGLNFRYLTEISEGSVNLEYMPEDYIRNESRYSGSLRSVSQFTPELSANIDLNYISDDDYLDELGNALSVSDRRHVRSRADLQYQNDYLNFLTRVETYQTIDRTILTNELPYQKLPQVQLNLRHTFDDLPIDIGMENEFVYFYRSNRTTGQRLNFKPYLAFPYSTASGFITPKIALQYTQYFLEDRPKGEKDNLSRVLPIASVNSGLFFERELSFGNSSVLHTIEPQLYYLYIPHTRQDHLPLFDTAENDFTFNSLFRENRFSGSDRIQDTNQLSLALTTRLIDADSGMEYLKLAVGEIFYFKNQRTNLINRINPETRDFSNLVAELSGRLTQDWSFTSGVQWNPDINDITRGYAGFQYAHEGEKIVNVGYHYRKDELAQSDISFRWPIYNNWYAVARWQYSLKFNTTKESFIGLEKESCCWRFRIIGRRYINSIRAANEAESQTGIFVQLELKGLSSIGDNVEKFLEKNISGYEEPL